MDTKAQTASGEDLWLKLWDGKRASKAQTEGEIPRVVCSLMPQPPGNPTVMVVGTAAAVGPSST